jgi:hypothetical protein
MIYFISGHRNLPYEDFEKYYTPIIDKAIREDDEAKFVIGDCCGVDKFAMDYIFNKDICHITIYHMFNKPRNIPEANTRVILDLVDFRGGFKSDEERDSAMTRDSDFDIAFVKDCRWNSGTAQNIKRRYNI